MGIGDSLEEKDMLESLDEVAKEKFYEEYLNDKIIYSWIIKKHEGG